MNSPLRLHLVNHNLRYIDWPHGYGDPSAYWRSVGQRHASGPMVLTEDLAAAVLGSPAMFARKLDLEMPEGVDFMQRWDKWMSYKLQTGTDHDAVQVGSAESRPQPSPRPAPLHPEPLRVCVPRVASTAGHRIRPTRGRRHAACNSASAHGRGPQRSRGGGDCRSLRCASCPLRARRRDAPPVCRSPAAAAAAAALAWLRAVARREDGGRAIGSGATRSRSSRCGAGGGGLRGPRRAPAGDGVLRRLEEGDVITNVLGRFSE